MGDGVISYLCALRERAVESSTRSRSRMEEIWKILPHDPTVIEFACDRPSAASPRLPFHPSVRRPPSLRPRRGGAVCRLDPASGRLELYRELRAGFAVQVTPDGAAYVYGYRFYVSNLMLIEGLQMSLASGSRLGNYEIVVVEGLR